MNATNTRPKRVTVTHARTNGLDVFTVSANARAARRAAADATTRGFAVVSQSARFDFTLASWGLALDAVWASCPAAVRALATATPKAPRAPKAPKAPKMRGGPAFATPPPTHRGQKLVVLAGLEDLLVLKLRDTGVTQDVRDSFETYKKLKTRALSPSINQATQNEADTALRIATINLVKLAF